MSELHKINRIIHAVAGWWMLYRGEEGSEWYTPVAGWAECSFFDEGRGGGINTRRIIPASANSGGCY